MKESDYKRTAWEDLRRHNFWKGWACGAAFMFVAWLIVLWMAGAPWQ